MLAPYFSIVITCYNQAHLIRDAVDSALRQDYPRHEVIVVDDASTDFSAAILESYGCRIHFYSLKNNGGAAHARNIGAAAAAGDYLAFLDGDDALQPWALTIYRRIIDNSSPKLILGSLHWCKTRLPVILDPAPRQIEFVNYDCWADKDRTFRSSASSLVVERAAFEAVNGWAEDVSVFEDQYLETKLAYSGRAIQIISPATVLYRLHDSNITLDTRKLISACLGFVAAYRKSSLAFDWRRRFFSSALIGGPAFWVLRRACRAGLLSEGSKLFMRSWSLVSIAALARCRAVVRGRHPIETLGTAEFPQPCA